jgi:uncharacterized protein (TIGR02246 family)
VEDPTLDERDIRRVLAEYCVLVDDGDFTGLLDCFTEDAEFIFAGRSRRGHERLRRFFEATGTPEQRGKHMTANTIVDVEGDTARATSDYVFFVRSNGGFVALLAGRYLDELRRDRGRWRFSRREAITL